VRRAAVVLFLVAGVVALGQPASGDPTGHRRPRVDGPARAHAAPTDAPGPRARQAPRPPRGRGLTLLGATDIGGRGFNGDVWVHKGFAYVGRWGVPPACPGGGVAVIDVSNPASPTRVAEFAAYPGTTAEDVVVVSASGRSFRGDLAAVGLQDCGPGGRQALDLWDLTDPRRPRHLGFHPTLPGVHELSVVQRGAQTLALLAVPFAEVETSLASGGRDVKGDFQIVDISDPRRPRALGDWGAGKDGGLALGSPVLSELGPPFDCTPPPGGEPLCRGNDFPGVFAHSASGSRDGRRAYLSYWDAGMIILGISDPTRPRMIGRTPADPTEEGNTHSAVEAFGGRVAITTDEDFSPLFDPNPPPGDHWGLAHVWDISDPARPVELATIATPNALTARTDGDYSVHNPFVRGTRLYLAWYSDGVQVFDISRPDQPRHLAGFVPPPVPDPFGILPTAPEVWGVVVEGRTVYLSDMNAGLYVLTGP
jgi:hypothetical protein